jgi:hypothetical protein
VPEKLPSASVDGWQREIIRAVASRPGLWPTALRQAVRMAPRGWWRRPPFVPVPDPSYLRFRLQTAYGNDGEPTAEDVVAYLRWCREFPGS